MIQTLPVPVAQITPHFLKVCFEIISSQKVARGGEVGGGAVPASRERPGTEQEVGPRAGDAAGFPTGEKDTFMSAFVLSGPLPSLMRCFQHHPSQKWSSLPLVLPSKLIILTQDRKPRNM